MALRTSSTATSTASCFTSAMATIAPSAANLRAVARPMPCAPPVTMLTLSFKRCAAPARLLMLSPLLSSSNEPLRHAAERQHLVDVPREVGDLVVRPVDHTLARVPLFLDHRAPVDHFVAGGRNEKVA